ncbi:MFS transporter [Roseiterribacter gracilis]|uniref:MFS transporter n=1 Tax=Roseiterribacter gracilis TaxID=2812848 RepID=A0A8S8XA47_9PROT|nr:MFS transporter [Rhodospirillales bacterium TMPK1]
MAAVVSYTDRLILNLLVDPIRADLGISDTQVSLLQGAAFAVLYACAGLPLGRIADRWPRRNVIVAGVLIWSLATVACGLATDFPTLFIARIWVGIGEAALAPAAVSMIADLFPPSRRGFAIGVFLTGMVVGGGAAISIGGALLSLIEGGAVQAWPIVGAMAPWRSVMVLVGLAGIPVAIAVMTLYEPQRTKTESAALSMLDSMRRLARDARVLAPIYGAAALISIGDYGFLGWAPSLLSRRYGWTPMETGAAIGVLLMATGAAGALIGGAFADRLQKSHGVTGRLRLALFAALAALASVPLLLLDSSSAAVAATALWSLASTAAGAIAITALQDLVPNELRGLGTSLVAFGNTIVGLGLGPTLVALATERVYGDPRALHVAIATAVIPAAILACLMLRSARRSLLRTA